MSAESLIEQPTYRIRPGVAKVRREQAILLVTPEGGNCVRVSPVAEELMPLLADGAHFAQLAARLKANHPGVVDIEPKLTAFLNQLQRSGVLHAEPLGVRSGPRRIVLCHPDAAARYVSRLMQLLPAWLAWAVYALLMLGSGAGIACLTWQGALPQLPTLIVAFDPAAILVFLLAVVPAHEFAHALACRLAGAAAGPAGLLFHGGLMPGPFVDTTAAYRLASRWRRFWIAAAGPSVDFMAAGAAACALLLVPSESAGIRATAAYLFELCALFFILDINPIVRSDGSRMLEAVMDDELARRSALSSKRALLSSRRAVACYRLICTLYVQVTLVTLYLWWMNGNG